MDAGATNVNNGNQGEVTPSAGPTNSGVPHANDFDDVWCAARRGDRNAVREFLNNGTDPDIEDECGNPPLYYSVLYGHRKICKDLVRSGAECALSAAHKCAKNRRTSKLQIVDEN